MKLGIAGFHGRMGKAIRQELDSGAWPDLSFAAGSTADSNPEDLFAASDLVIDFTTPTATAKHLWIAAKHHVPLVIGTTGLDDKLKAEMQTAAAETAILYSANMSIGVNLLAALVEQAARALDSSFDIEILETHHRNKIDAPSGTALMLGQAAAAGRGIKDAKFTPDRLGTRTEGAIGYAVQRGGDVVGEHTVGFFGHGERVELTHRAHDRSLFAKGALRAATWLKNKPPGLYTMRDVLGL